MADGKFLRALVELRSAAIINETAFLRAADAAVKRIEAQALPGFGGGVAWGLNFPWEDRPVTEVYLITTALVIRGLLDLRRHAASAVDEQLLNSATASILSWPRADFRGMSAPIYSVHIPRPVFNTIGQWLIVVDRLNLQKDSGVRTDDFISFLESTLVREHGWVYEPGSRRIDLLHCCYTLEAYAHFTDIQASRSLLLQIAGAFARDDGFIDAVDILPWSEAVERRSPTGLRFMESFAVLQSSRDARPWSIAELMVRLTDNYAADKPVIRGLARHIAGCILAQLEDEGTGAIFHNGNMRARHAMHILHGLASLLRVEREKRQQLGLPE
jgi:hypothetical protein